MTHANSDPQNWADGAGVNHVNEVRSHTEVTNGPVPQNVSQPALLNHDDDARRTKFADNELRKRLCSFFFKLAFQVLDMRPLFRLDPFGAYKKYLRELT